MEQGFVHGIVLYTISNDELRSKFNKFVLGDLEGHFMNESSYSLPRTGNTEAKERITQFCKDMSFDDNDFVDICYSAALLDYSTTEKQKDQIIVFHIVNKK